MRSDGSSAELDGLIGDAGAVRAGFEELPEPVVLLDGPEYRLLAMNAAYRAFSGREGVIGATMREAFPEIEDQPLFGLVEKVYTTGEAVHAREWWMRFDPGDGEREFCMDFDLLPRFREDGTVHGVLIKQTDVTARVRERLAAEETAQRAQERYLAAHEVVLELQQALLPDRVPVLPALDVMARYVVAGTEQSAGGDWFDVRVLPDGRIGLVVGDVVGHGVAAAATMSQLRAVLADALDVTSDPVAALERLERFAAGLPAARATTVAVAVLDPGDGTMDYVTRGHPAPVVVDADGRARQLLGSGGGPVGADPGGPAQRTGLGPGEVVVLFSDGLVERPDRPYAAGLDDLARVVERAVPGEPAALATRVCTDVVDGLLRVQAQDDATVLVAARRPPVETLDHRAASTRAGLSDLRQAVRLWLQALRIDPVEQLGLEMAIGEAVDNAVEHGLGYRTDGTVAVHAELTADARVHVRIEDDGSWREPSETGRDHAPDRGHGLTVLGSVGDDLDVQGSPEGTVLTFHRRLSRLVSTSVPERAAAPAAVVPPPFALSLSGPPAVLRVEGPVDAGSVDELRRGLAGAARGGTAALEVDLGGVTHLTSVGVAALVEALRRAEGSGHGLTLLAPTGSPAAFVLDLVGLPRGRPDGEAR